MKFSFGLVVALVAGGASAAPAMNATSTVIKALICEMAPGQGPSVLAALKALGATPGKRGGEFILPAPITAFGLAISRLNAVPSDGEAADSYTAVFPKAQLADIAKIAQLKPLAGGHVRDTKHGRLSADVRDREDIHLTCTATQ